MQPQQQTVVTNISQPYLTASVVNSYRHRQSTIIGILLIIAGALSILFNITDIAVGRTSHIIYGYTLYPIYKLSNYSNGVVGHGFWCGAMVSSQLNIRIFVLLTR